MRVIRIIVDGREYALPAQQDVEAIMARITEQVRAGGGFVQLLDAPGRALSLLVSPGMSLTIETSVRDDEVQPSESVPGPAPSWFDPFDIA